MHRFLVIIDGLSLMFNLFPYTQSFESKISSSQSNKKYGTYIACKNYITFIKGLYCNPLIIVVWESVNPTISRKNIFSDYKKRISKAKPSFVEQLDLCKMELKNIKDITQIEDSKFEFIDFCESLKNKYEKELPIRILSSNRNTLQFVNFNTNLWLLLNSSEQAITCRTVTQAPSSRISPPLCCSIDALACFRLFHFFPQNYLIYNVLTGNPQINTPSFIPSSSQTSLQLTNYYFNIFNLINDIKCEKENAPQKWSTYLKMNFKEAKQAYSSCSQNLELLITLNSLSVPTNTGLLL